MVPLYQVTTFNHDRRLIKIKLRSPCLCFLSGYLSTNMILVLEHRTTKINKLYYLSYSRANYLKANNIKSNFLIGFYSEKFILAKPSLSYHNLKYKIQKYTS